MEEWKEVFQFYCEERNRQYLSNNLLEQISSLTQRLNKGEYRRWERIRNDLIDRKIEIIHSDNKIEIINVVHNNTLITITYKVRITWKLKQGINQYEQSWQEKRKCLLKEERGWVIIEDEFMETEQMESSFLESTLPIALDADYEIRNPNERRKKYDRKKAVEYAERWWNDYNPKFRHFDVDCTNYVSQCLWAGGATMKYASDRAKGWWYRFEEPINWSFSWAVAHSLRWFLAASQSGLRGKEVSSADQLQLGDVICYDFNGDGRWQHNTFVVSKDASGMPLVNAHTTNSRQRYWTYRDSYAWTEKTVYKFFQIEDNF